MKGAFLSSPLLGLGCPDPSSWGPASRRPVLGAWCPPMCSLFWGCSLDARRGLGSGGTDSLSCVMRGIICEVI